MAFEFNPFTGTLDIVDKTLVLPADPASGKEGQWLINTTSELLKIYYSGAWVTIFTFTPAAVSYLLLETGDRLLMENNDIFTLE